MLNLRKIGYSCGFNNHYTNKVKFLDRSFELKPKIKRQLKRIVFVTRFTPSAKQAMHLIKNTGLQFNISNCLITILLPPPMLAYKSNKNLKSFLVRSKLPSLDCNIETTPIGNLTVEYTPISNIETNYEDRQS